MTAGAACQAATATCAITRKVEDILDGDRYTVQRSAPVASFQLAVHLLSLLQSCGRKNLDETVDLWILLVGSLEHHSG